MLQQLLQGKRARKNPSDITSHVFNAPVPISVEQEHIWLHESVAPGALFYNEAITIHRRGTCDTALLARSLNEVLRRHEIWRTDFQSSGSNLVQRVHDSLAIDLPFTDLSDLPTSERYEVALKMATDDARLPFDLSRAPLIRGRILKLDEGEHRLCVSLHHMIFDGVSLYQVLLPTLAAVYASLAAGLSAEAAGPAFPVMQYRDYALWRSDRLTGEGFARQQRYWRHKLAGDLPVLRLAGDRTPGPVQSHRGGMETFTLPASTTKQLNTVSLELRTTKYVLLLTCFKALLFRYTGQTDIMVGGAVDMRKHSAFSSLLGYFLNTLPIRTQPTPGMSFRDYAVHTGNAVLEMLDASDVPLSQVVAGLQPGRGAAAEPLFQAFFSIQPPAPFVAEGWDEVVPGIRTGC